MRTTSVVLMWFMPSSVVADVGVDVLAVAFDGGGSGDCSESEAFMRAIGIVAVALGGKWL